MRNERLNEIQLNTLNAVMVFLGNDLTRTAAPNKLDRTLALLEQRI